MTESMITIGSSRSECITIAVERRSYADSTDYWDGNWCNATIRAKLGGFQAKCDASLRTTDFAELLEGVKTLYVSLEHKAVFETMEEQLSLVMQGDDKGHITVSGTLLDQPGIGNALRFQFEMDQSYLPSLINELEMVTVRFPVLHAQTAGVST